MKQKNDTSTINKNCRKKLKGCQSELGELGGSSKRAGKYCTDASEEIANIQPLKK